MLIAHCVIGFSVVVFEKLLSLSGIKAVNNLSENGKVEYLRILFNIYADINRSVAVGNKLIVDVCAFDGLHCSGVNVVDLDKNIAFKKSFERFN